MREMPPSARTSAGFASVTPRTDHRKALTAAAARRGAPCPVCNEQRYRPGGCRAALRQPVDNDGGSRHDPLLELPQFRAVMLGVGGAPCDAEAFPPLCRRPKCLQTAGLLCSARRGAFSLDDHMHALRRHGMGMRDPHSRPWDGPNACGCGAAGAPCGRCNIPEDGEAPRMPDGFEMEGDKDGWLH
jgi:hypothetical protein